MGVNLAHKIGFSKCTICIKFQTLILLISPLKHQACASLTAEKGCDLDLKCLGGTFPPKDRKQSPLHLFVSHAVDDRVGHGSEDNIQHREHPVSQARVCRAVKDAAEA